MVLALVSGVSFLLYGLGVVRAGKMKDEFDRYGLAPSTRLLVGVLELLGAAGVLLGLAVPPLGAAAAAGLCTLMLLGVGVRVRVGDPVARMVPAASLAVVNGVLAVLFLQL